MRGRELAEKAIEIDSNFLMAKANVAYSHIHDGWNRYTESPDASFEAAKSIIDRVLEENPDHAYTVGALGFYYRYTGHIDLAVETAERAVALSPSDQVNHGILGLSLSFGPSCA